MGTFWDAIEFKDDTVRHWQVGPTGLWVRRTAEEWQTTVHRTAGQEGLIVAEPGAPQDAATWTRWAAQPDETTFRIKPVMPDRPVLVRPDAAFFFPPNSELMFYVSIPVWLRLSVGGKKETRMTDIPVNILSNSWFGDSIAGMLCYALRTTARRYPEALRKQPYLAACPIFIRNRAKTSMPFERLCVRTAHLHLYHDGERLWTNQMTVTFEGEQQPDSITYDQSPPSVAPNASLVSEAQTPLKKNVLQRSFDDIKSFARLG